MATHTFSPFGCSGNGFINRDDLSIKIVIDPQSHYFNEDVKKDRLEYDKLILMQGMEPKEISYISQEIIKNHEYFDVILTSYQEVLDSCKNAKQFSCTTCWVLTDKDENQLHHLKKDYYNIFNTEKKFKLSHIMSDKNWLPGHILRHKTAELIRKKRKFELLFPEHIDSKIKLFKDSMFHISIENSQNHNYITEKVIDCFMSYTVPIYWGCPNITDYFDKDGIIFFETEEDLENILDNLTEDDYLKRKNAVLNNYQIAFEKHGFWCDRVNEIIKAL
jgi:hypothetical protein